MFAPECDVCRGGVHGHGPVLITHGVFGEELGHPVTLDADDGPDDHDHLAVMSYPLCHLCGRVLTDEDHADDAGFEGDVAWCSRLHSPEGLEELAAWIEFDRVEQERVHEASLLRLKGIIDDAVRQALEDRGLA